MSMRGNRRRQIGADRAPALLLVSFALLMPFVAPAQAQLLGTNVKIAWLYPNAATIFATATKPVIQGAEVNCPGGQGPGDTSVICQAVSGGPFSIDVAAASITLNSSGNMFSSFPGTSFNGFKFTFPSGTPRVLGVSLITNDPLAASTRVSFTANSAALNLQGLDRIGTPPRFYTLSVLFAAPPAEVPATSTTALALLGLTLTLAAAAALRRLGDRRARGQGPDERCATVDNFRRGYRRRDRPPTTW